MVESYLAPKWPILVPFCRMHHQKSNFLLIFSTFPVGGCWGQPMLLFWKLLMKLKCPILLKLLSTIIQKQCWFFYPSEPFSFIRLMRHCTYTSRMNVPVCKMSTVVSRQIYWDQYIGLCVFVCIRFFIIYNVTVGNCSTSSLHSWKSSAKSSCFRIMTIKDPLLTPMAWPNKALEVKKKIEQCFAF